MFIIFVAITKEMVWKSRVKRVMTGNVISGPRLGKYFAFHLRRNVELQRRCLSERKMGAYRTSVARERGRVNTSGVLPHVLVMERGSRRPGKISFITSSVLSAVCPSFVLYTFEIFKLISMLCHLCMLNPQPRL